MGDARQLQNLKPQSSQRTAAKDAENFSNLLRDLV
jgi:hypothetical protein